MATTNAAITQANGAIQKLNTAANAQANAEAGVRPTQNLGVMNKNYTTAANGFRGVANKMNKLNLPNIAKNFTAAADAAEAAGAARAAANAAQGLKKLQNAMITNSGRIANGQEPTNGAGLV